MFEFSSVRVIESQLYIYLYIKKQRENLYTISQINDLRTTTAKCLTHKEMYIYKKIIIRRRTDEEILMYTCSKRVRTYGSRNLKIYIIRSWPDFSTTEVLNPDKHLHNSLESEDQPGSEV